MRYETDSAEVYIYSGELQALVEVDYEIYINEDYDYSKITVLNWFIIEKDDEFPVEIIDDELVRSRIK